ncbi:MAG: potassium channel family protein [Cetobacterium sp.]
MKRIFKFLKMLLITGIISVIVPLIAHGIFKSHSIYEINDYRLNVLKIFLSILPLNVLVVKDFLFKDGVIKSTCLIFYYVLLVPFISLSLNIEEDPALKYFYLTLSIVNALLLIASHVILLKYVFNDFFLRKRKIVPRDIFIVLTTYVTLAISFGLIYTVLDITSTEPLFKGFRAGTGTFDYYFQHIYFSFITISTVGYGDITPNSTIIEFLVILEIIIGFLITNVILALILGSGIFNSLITENNKNKKKSDRED